MHGHERDITVERRLPFVSNPCWDVGNEYEFVLEELLEIPTQVDIVQVLEQFVHGHVRKVAAPHLWIGCKYLPLSIDRNDHRAGEHTAREGWDGERTAPLH